MTGQKRIRMTRQEPWRVANPLAVVVSRPGVFGNPFRVIKSLTPRGGTADWCVTDGSGQYTLAVFADRAGAHDGVVQLFDSWLDATELPAFVSAPDWMVDPLFSRLQSARETIWNNIDRLKGHDVACWCPLELACHGDSYLRRVNDPVGVR